MTQRFQTHSERTQTNTEPAASDRPVHTPLHGRNRVLIVDDHPIVRRGMAVLVGEQPDMEVCGEADGVDDALRLVKQTRPNVVIVDLSLGSGHGIDLIERIHAYNPHIRMLVVSVHDEELYAERSLRAGAGGYVNKQEATDRLVHAIRRVLDGEVYLSGTMSDRLLSNIVAGESSSDNPIDALSNRELEVFELIGSGLMTKQIAAQLDLSPKTVETHREKIKAKLNLATTTELTRHAVQWVLESR